MPLPEGVAIGKGGVCYVTSGDKIVSLTQPKQDLMTVAGGLDSPGRLDLDHQTGEFWVFQRGDSQQVVRLSAAGEILRTYGRKGGRQDGLYRPQDFDAASDVCADGRGGFCVAEPFTAPRRVAHLNSEGQIISDWYGGQPWDTHGAFEPGNPNAMWIASAWSQDLRTRTVIRATIDYEKKLWQVHSTYKYVSPVNPLTHDSGNEGSFFRIRRHDGVNYFVIEGLPCIHKIDEQAWRLIPVTALTSEFQWNDQNGDALVQENEKSRFDSPLAPTFSVSHIGSNFDCFFIPINRRPFQVRRMPVVEWNAQGAPIYGSLPAGEEYAECPERFNIGIHNDVRWGSFLLHDAASGNLYGALNPATANWCTSADSFLQQWNARKDPTWAVGELGPAPTSGLPSFIPTKQGLIYWNLRGITGVTHGCVVAIDVDGGWTNETARTYVWDQDGLFVGGIMDQPDLKAAPDFLYHCGGEFAHSDLFTLPDGNVYFAGNWESDIRIYKVTGWDDWTRQSGSFAVDSPSADQLGQGLMAEYFGGTKFAKPVVVQVDPEIDFGLEIGQTNGAPAGLLDAQSVRWRGAVRPELGPKYIGYWNTAAKEGVFDKSVRIGRDNGASVEFKFHGTAVSVVGYKAANCGFVNFHLDGEEVVHHFDCYSPTELLNQTFFERSGLSDNDHVLVVEVVGWLGAPRNKDSTDSNVYLDKFVVDGTDIDDGGLPYTFYTTTDGGVQFWLGSSTRADADTCLIYDWSTKSQPHESASAPVKLERKEYPLQLNYLRRSGAGRVALAWSSPQNKKQILPTRVLLPVTIASPLPAIVMDGAFLGTDAKTQGNWKGIYGQDGYAIPNAGEKYPAYLTMKPNGTFYTWWAPGADMRALQMPNAEGLRRGSLVLPGSQQHDVRLPVQRQRVEKAQRLRAGPSRRKPQNAFRDSQLPGPTARYARRGGISGGNLLLLERPRPRAVACVGFGKIGRCPDLWNLLRSGRAG